MVERLAVLERKVEELEEEMGNRSRQGRGMGEEVQGGGEAKEVVGKEGGGGVSTSPPPGHSVHFSGQSSRKRCCRKCVLTWDMLQVNMPPHLFPPVPTCPTPR